MRSINPYSLELIAEYKEWSKEETENAIVNADRAQQFWAEKPLQARLLFIKSLAAVIRKRKQEIAELITVETGKPIQESIAEVEKCAFLADFISKEENLGLAPRNVNTEAKYTYISYEPLGLIFAVMPWNFPLWQVLRLSLPAIAVGNAVLLKHASNVWGTALLIEDLFREAGFPAHIFTTLLLTAKATEPVIAHPAVRAVSLTGSESAGKAIARLAGAHLKKAVMELGGSDAFIVLKDADIKLAAETALKARMLNNGQVCIAAKRFIIHEAVYEEFIEYQLKLFSNLKIGDPLLPNTDIGPLARPDLLLQLEAQLEVSVNRGAKIVVGGKRHQTVANTLEPTLLTNIKPDMPVWKEETFGPIMPIMKFSSIEEAIQLANDSEFGLGASIWTKDIEAVKEILPKIKAGSVFVNSMVKSDPRVPFGGIKNSGFGRELSFEGIKEFVNIKTNWIN